MENAFLLPKTGIVIPSFNQGRFIERAILSVLDNAKHCPIKLVVMDGGSTDGTLDVLKKYHSKIDYWQSKPDGGQAAAVNAAIEFLKDCEFVAWLNSDDEYDNEWSVHTMVCAMQKSGAQIAYGRSHLIDEKSKIIGEYPVCTETTNERLFLNCCLSQPSVFIRKTAWEQAGGLNPALYMCLDYDLWIRLAKIYPLTYVDAVIGNTRIYEDTKTSLFQDRHLLEGIYILNRHYGQVPLEWIKLKYTRDHFGSTELNFLQKICRKLDLRLNYNKILTAYLNEAERVLNA